MPGTEDPRSEASDREAAFPGIGNALWLVAATIMCQVVVFATLYGVGVIDRKTWVDGLVIATLFGNGIVLVTWSSRQRVGYRDVVHPAHESPAATVGLVTVPILLILPAAVLTGALVQTVLADLVPMSERQMRMFSQIIEGGAASLLGIVLVAPLVEELLFRGIILRGFLRRHSQRNALVLSSLVFGAAHLNLYQFVGSTLLGLILGWLYIRFRSTLPGMLFHALYNGGVLLLAAGTGGEDARFTDQVPLSVWVGAAPLLAVGTYALRMLAHKTRATSIA